MKILPDILILLCFFAFSTGCGSPEHTFSADELKTVDSLFILQKDSIELVMKTKCDSLFQDNYRELVDSLKTVRQKEILDIITK